MAIVREQLSNLLRGRGLHLPWNVEGVSSEAALYDVFKVLCLAFAEYWGDPGVINTTTTPLPPLNCKPDFTRSLTGNVLGPWGQACFFEAKHGSLETNEALGMCSIGLKWS